MNFCCIYICLFFFFWCLIGLLQFPFSFFCGRNHEIGWIHSVDLLFLFSLVVRSSSFVIFYSIRDRNEREIILWKDVNWLKQQKFSVANLINTEKGKKKWKSKNPKRFSCSKSRKAILKAEKRMVFVSVPFFWHF